MKGFAMKRKSYFVSAIVVLVLVPGLLLTAPISHAQDKQPDVIFVPTPHQVVDKMFELADPRPGEVHYDLGCGDGRLCVTAAKKFGLKSFGWDIDPARVQDSLNN